MSSDWTSLETTKVVVSCLTPLVVTGVGIYIHHITKRFEHSLWRHQKVIEKRLAVYDSLAPKLNEVLCYFTHVGTWRDVDPKVIVQMKRKIDKEVHLARPLFSTEFFEQCTRFIDVCYATYQGWGIDAQLRTTWKDRQEVHEGWNNEWKECFAEEVASKEEVRKAYASIMAAFSKDLGLAQPAQKRRWFPFLIP
mgnify:CR=1 FL=1